ncbi:MAG: acetyl-CoA acetyltransferase [Deltaproteobacteria bacterium]|nr:MAG: acetyl-CoA acetyltransferase [Deltaproteobacteria bacterium]
MTKIDPRTPVLVGAAAVEQRLDDPEQALEPVELMIAALERAAGDAGSSDLLARADSIRAPRGIWDYPDPCRLIAERFGCPGARTEVAEVGVLQTTLIGRAAADIAAGRSDIALIAGGEAKYRARRAKRLGVEAPLARQDSVEPDSVLRPESQIVSENELRVGLAMPVTQYSMMENALRAAEGRSLEEHRREVATLWARMSEVAAANPHAWSRQVFSAEEIAVPGPGNPMLAFPYTKLCTSQWNVDQAAGLILCSAEAAQSLGVSRDRWLFPWAVADSNAMVPVSERRELHRCPGYALAAEAIREHTGIGPGDVEHLELYSCFPVAVRIQAREMEIDETRRPVSLTGGMTFAGGPLNNFVYQALVRMTEVLRGDSGARGLVTAVSGMLTKQGVSLWSSAPPPAAFRFLDVTEQTARTIERVPVASEASGEATVVTYTVLFEDGEPTRTVVLCDLDSGGRVLASFGDAGLASEATERELCGMRVRLGEGRLDLI